MVGLCFIPLHLLPAVPGMPFSGSRWQKSGEAARYSRSLVAGGFTWGSRGSMAVLDPIRVRRTWEQKGFEGTRHTGELGRFLRRLWNIATSVAPSKRSLRTTPTRLNGGITFQQVLNSQDPETPWHLHSTCMLCRMALAYKESGCKSNSETNWDLSKQCWPFVRPRCCGGSWVAALLTALWPVRVHLQMFGRKPRRRTGCHCSRTTGNLQCKTVPITHLNLTPQRWLQNCKSNSRQQCGFTHYVCIK